MSHSPDTPTLSDLARQVVSAFPPTADRVEGLSARKRWLLGALSDRRWSRTTKLGGASTALRELVQAGLVQRHVRSHKGEGLFGPGATPDHYYRITPAGFDLLTRLLGSPIPAPPEGWPSWEEMPETNLYPDGPGRL